MGAGERRLPLVAEAVAERAALLGQRLAGGGDALALALVLSSPELDLRGVSTVGGDAHTRALIVCRLLHAVGRADVPVASGAPPRDPPEYHGQFQYGLRPAFRKRPVKEDAVEF